MRNAILLGAALAVATPLLAQGDIAAPGQTAQGDVAVTIDELFGQRSFNDAQQQPADSLAHNVLTQGRYAHFVDRVYDLAEDSWGIFSLEKLSRTPEFRQAAA